MQPWLVLFSFSLLSSLLLQPSFNHSTMLVSYVSDWYGSMSIGRVIVVWDTTHTMSGNQLNRNYQLEFLSTGVMSSYYFLSKSTLSHCDSSISFYSSYYTVTRPAFAQRVEAPKMMVDSVQLTDIAQNANLIATNSGDFGGAAFPILGLGLIAALILFLSPPLADQ